MKRWGVFLLLLLSLCVRPAVAATEQADLVIYGATPAGIAAAVQAARMHHRVLLLEPSGWIGGMMTGGLGASDKGVTWTVGGLAREFFEKIYAYYLAPEHWRSETRAEYLPKHPLTHTEAMHCQWFFEPHVGRGVFEAMLAQPEITIRLHERLDRAKGVIKENGSIRAIVMENGLRAEGRTFIDASYEGDLMAAAGVEYVVGRDANSRFGETLNGIYYQKDGRLRKNDPFIIAGNPASGLLPRIEPHPPGPAGTADNRLQAYNFRLCLTDQPDNRVEIPKPEHYDPLQYELLLRQGLEHPQQMPGTTYYSLTPMPNHKTDTNNRPGISTDFIGGNTGWTEADYAERDKMLQAHRDYDQGLFWFLAHDPRVPDAVRQEAARWGLPKDEFTDNGHWPTQLYIREARRMVGLHVMSEQNFSRKEKDQPAIPAREPVTDPVAIGSYALDSHEVSLFVDEKNGLNIEGHFLLGVKPFGISYRSLLPKPEQCANLLVPVCLSASHVAYGSIRMEPVFMELGQAAGTAACLALDQHVALAALPYESLRARLLADRAVLSPEKSDDTP